MQLLEQHVLEIDECELQKHILGRDHQVRSPLKSAKNPTVNSTRGLNK